MEVLSMTATQTAVRESSTGSSGARRPEVSKLSNAARRPPTDDEILGIGAEAADTPTVANADSKSGANAGAEHPVPDSARDAAGEAAEPESLRAAFDENPELREAWRDAQAYREAFATPEEARAATELVADLNHMDALFFSKRPEDHTALAQAVAELDPVAFASLVKAMNGVGGEDKRAEDPNRAGSPAQQTVRPVAPIESERQPATTTAAQEQFFHSTNAAAVQTVLDANERSFSVGSTRCRPPTGDRFVDRRARAASIARRCEACAQ
jgi:hypothetical protein